MELGTGTFTGEHVDSDVTPWWYAFDWCRHCGVRIEYVEWVFPLNVFHVFYWEWDHIYEYEDGPIPMPLCRGGKTLAEPREYAQLTVWNSEDVLESPQSQSSRTLP